jgi:tetratricopeptide (TPR) repeat protein
MASPTLVRYRAFISYSHADTRWAKWLLGQLEGFRVEKELIGRSSTMGPIPKALRPIFRDRDEFPAGREVKNETVAALDRSAALVVLCSPASARSRYVNEEVRLFKQRHPERPIIPVIVDGEPGDSELECFPPAARREVGTDGIISDRPIELLAADLREHGDGRELAAAKVVARLLGLPTDDVFRRANRERLRKARVRNSIIAILALLTVAATSSALYAWDQLKTNDAFLSAVLKRVTEIISTAVSQAERYNVPRRATLELLGNAEGLLDDMARLSRSTQDLRHRRAWMVIEFARNYALLGDTGKQRERAFEAHRLLTELVAESPSHSIYQHDLSFAQNEVGDVWAAQGNLSEALEAFRRSIAIRERLTKTDSNKAGWQRDLSVSYNKIGDILATKGDLAGALQNYRTALAIRDTLVQADPSNTSWQRDLSASHNKIGDVLAVEGNLSDALISFRTSRAIFHRLTIDTPSNAGWQRDLSVAYIKIGDIQAAQSNLSEALISYHESLVIFDRLAKSDPDNFSWQRDLSVSHNKIGDVLAAQGNILEALNSLHASSGIFQRLAKTDPRNAGWQRDLAVSYNKIGDVFAAQGDRPNALSFFRRSQAIFDRLVAAEPNNADWQRDLAVSHERIGDIDRAIGNNAAATSAYERALSIYEALLRVNPNNSHILASSILPLLRLGSLSADRRHEYLSRALRMLKRLEESGLLLPDQKSTIPWLEEELGERAGSPVRN